MAETDRQADRWALASAGFDLVMHRSWPALLVEEHQGWLFRTAAGVTKRANSVLSSGWHNAGPSSLSALPALSALSALQDAVERAEEYYRGLGLPCISSAD